VEEKALTLEVSLLQYAAVLTLAGPEQDPIDLPSICPYSRGLGPCGCEFVLLLLAWLSCLRAQTGIMLASGVVQETRLDGPGRNPQELHFKPRDGLQVVSRQ
jgi:hypothetical protein